MRQPEELSEGISSLGTMNFVYELSVLGIWLVTGEAECLCFFYCFQLNLPGPMVSACAELRSADLLGSLQPQDLISSVWVAGGSLSWLALSSLFLIFVYLFWFCFCFCLCMSVGMHFLRS